MIQWTCDIWSIFYIFWKLNLDHTNSKLQFMVLLVLLTLFLEGMTLFPSRLCVFLFFELKSLICMTWNEKLLMTHQASKSVTDQRLRSSNKRQPSKGLSVQSKIWDVVVFWANSQSRTLLCIAPISLNPGNLRLFRRFKLCVFPGWQQCQSSCLRIKRLK
jgi:hypothetical protein